MPTSYTEPIYEGKGISFREFAWRCARAFGAFIMQRDNSLDAPIVLREETNGYAELQIEKARLALDRLSRCTLQEAAEHAQADHASALTAWHELQAHIDARRARYEAMLAEVRAWTPPTEDHQGLAKMMEEQLLDSIEFDCKEWMDEPQLQEPSEWLAKQRQRTEDDLKYWTGSAARSQKAAEERNAWIEALVQSLGTPPQNNRL